MRWNKIRVILSVFIACSYATLICAQEITDTTLYRSYLDSLQQKVQSLDINSPTFDVKPSALDVKRPTFVVSSSASDDKPLTSDFKLAPIYYPTSLVHWNGGYVYGTNSMNSNKMWGYAADASIVATHNINDRLELTGSAGLHKVGGLYNTFSLDGSASYYLTPNVSVTAFGSYETPSFFTARQMKGAFQYGGYMSFETDNHKWGVDVGARHGFNPWTGQHYTVPIARPYYKIGKNKLGIDLGGLLKRQDTDGPPIFVPRPR